MFFFKKKEEGLHLFSQLRGNLVREKKGRVSAGGRALCPATWCGRGLPCATALFFSNEGVQSAGWV